MKKNRTHFRLTAITAAMIQAALLTPSVAGAETPPGMAAANGNTGVVLAPNGVPVVNIANPNAAGLSHNQYTQFNVDNRGAVLNNGDASQISRQSQLAGQVFANPNLQSQAKVILNEVVSPNRSQLGGYIEVLGGKADVVIANPWGITCNGCGFINTDRASLTTGTPVFGANGGLSGYQVTGGDVLVSGTGLDGKAQSYFDIVARTVKFDGQVNAGDLNVTTGSGNWDYASRSGTATAPSGSVTGYAFDSTALGGMYANRIKIVASEAGVGVRMLGDAAATASDFSIDAAGAIQIGSHLSAQGNMAVNTSASGAGALTLSGSGASLAAHGNINLAANSGGVTLTDAALAADGSLTVNAASLTDSSGTGATRFAGTDATLNIGNDANISGTSWGAGGSLGITAGAVTLGGNTALYSGSNTAAANRNLSLTASTGNLALGTGSVKSAGNMTLTSQQGNVTLAVGGAGVDAGGNLIVNALGALNNSGKMIAGGDVTVGAASLDNAGKIQGGGTATFNVATQNNSGTLLAAHTDVNVTNLTNSGTIQGSQSLGINATSLTNQAGSEIISDGTMTASGGSLVNKGLIQSANGANINVLGLQNQGSDAAILTSTTGSGAGVVSVSGALSNEGAIHGNGALSVTATSITNSNTGGISTGGSSDLTLKATGGAIDNSGALYAGGKLWLNTQNGANNYAFTNERSGTVGGTNLDFKVGNFTNYNEIVANNDIDVDAKGNFVNTLSTSDGLVPTITTKHVYGNGGALPPTGTDANEGPFNVYVKTISPYWNGQADVVYTSTESVVDVLSNANGLQSAKLIGGHAIKLNMTGSGSNHASLISAPLVDIKMNGGVFDNTSLDLTTTTYNRLWMSDMTDGDWDLYIPATLDQYNYLLNATDTQLYAIAESGNIPCNCYAGGILGSYPTINEHAGNQTLIWASLSSQGEGDWNAARAAAYAKVTTSTTTAASAQIKATSGGFSITGGTLSNVQSPYTPDNKAPVVPDATPPSNGSGFSGLDTTLPTNPNGNFVIDNKPGSKYVVETNPLYGPGSYLGSDYLYKLFGYDPDTLQKRLGDANYEDKLIRDQLIAQTGRNILAAYDNENEQLQALMDSAYAQSHDLGLQLGVPLTAAQTAALKSDLVWMVEQDVNGTKVLAPVIYLAAATRGAIATGAVIDAKTITVEGNGFNNIGGTVTASNKLSVNTTGDIVNTGGTVKGGNVSLNSSEGSIRNDILVVDAPADGSTSGVVGKQGSISATGTLDATAKKDIVIAGAATTAGGDMTLKAGNDVVVRTVVDATTDGANGVKKASIDSKNLSIDAGRDLAVTGASIKAGAGATIKAERDVVLDTAEQRKVSMTGSNSGVGDNTTVTSTTTVATKQIGSTLDVGKDLTLTSKNDITIAGSKVNVAGDATVDAAKNLNIVDRHDTTVVTTKTETNAINSGMTGVSFDNTKTTKTETTTKTVASGINVGGNGTLKAGETLTVKGSDVSTGGNLDVSGKSIQVLAAADTRDTVEHTVKTSQGMSMTGDANAAGIGYSNSKTTTDATDSSSTARTSTLTSGGNMTRTATEKITDQGTQISAGGDFTQKAKTIEMLAAENKQSSNTTSHTDTNSVGVSVAYGAGDAYNDAKHGSAAGATAASGGPTVGVDYSHQSKDSNSSGNGTQAVVTTVKAGGKIVSESTEDTRLQGTNLTSKGDTTIKARTLTVDAAHDTTSASNSSSQTTESVRVSVDVSGKPGVEGSVAHDQSKDGSDTSRAVVGKINSGGNLTVTTTGDTNLEGSKLVAKGDAKIDAGGNVNVTAATDTDNNSNSSLSVGATAGAAKKAGSGSVRVGSSDEDNKSTTAVAGSIEAGNNVIIKSGKDVKLEGTDVTAGKDATINATGKVDILAASSTTSSSSSSVNASVSGQGSKEQGGTKNNGNKMGAGAVSGSGSSSSTETKKVSNIKAGGDLKVISGDKITLEGTQADVGNKATLTAKGGVVKKDAVSKTSKSSTTGGISGGGGKGIGGAGGAVTSDHDHTESATSVKITEHNNKAEKTKKTAKAPVKTKPHPKTVSK